MKNKKPVPPAPIICILVNNEEKNSTHAVIFSLINLLITAKNSIVTDYFDYLNYYTIKQYLLFCDRILNKRNKELPVNQLHFLIFYSIFHFTIQLYKSKTIISYLQEQLPPERLETFDETSEVLIIFCTDALDHLRKGYKNNYAIAAAFTKIEAYRIPS